MDASSSCRAEKEAILDACFTTDDDIMAEQGPVEVLWQEIDDLETQILVTPPTEPRRGKAAGLLFPSNSLRVAT